MGEGGLKLSCTEVKETAGEDLFINQTLPLHRVTSSHGDAVGTKRLRKAA